MYGLADGGRASDRRARVTRQHSSRLARRWLDRLQGRLSSACSSTARVAGTTFVVSALAAYAAIHAFEGVAPVPAEPAAPAFASIAKPAVLDAAAPLVFGDDSLEDATPAAPSVEEPISSEDTLPLPDVQAAATIRVITGDVASGSTLAAALDAQGVKPQLVDEIAASLRPLFDFRQVRPGDHFALILDQAGEVVSFDYQRGRDETLQLNRAPGGALVASRKIAPLERRLVQVGGVVEGSLAESIARLGEGAELTDGFADIFQYVIDFAKQTQPGDEFRMLVEKYYDSHGFHHYGRVLAGQYTLASREHTAVWYEGANGDGDYYAPDGTSLRRTFLRAPLKYTRISSRYTKARLHPILRVKRPHEGIDYAAPIGTPIWSVADGTVIFKGWSGGLGRTVKVQHPNGYISYYGHLSRYANVRVGSRVRQQQVVGYVGKSGLATGPHLDYRLQYRGRFVDPLKVKFAGGDPVPSRELARFEEVRDQRVAELESVQVPLVLEAAM
jgi:murein DD-endopeptidase MepM/ murein hydrolase activator NlpD